MEMQGTYNAVGMIVALILGSSVSCTINDLTGVYRKTAGIRTMRSIGMTQETTKKLFVYEGIIYAVLAGMAGVAISRSIADAGEKFCKWVLVGKISFYHPSCYCYRLIRLRRQ